MSQHAMRQSDVCTRVWREAAVGEEGGDKITESLVCRLRNRAVPLDCSFIHLTNINDVPTMCKQNEDIYYSPSYEVNGRVT